MYALIYDNPDNYDAPEVEVFETRDEALARYAVRVDPYWLDDFDTPELAYITDPDFWIVPVTTPNTVFLPHRETVPLDR